MRYLQVLLIPLWLIATLPAFSQETDLLSEEQRYIDEMSELWTSIDRRTGTIKLPNGVATLEVPESFYYLSPADSEIVLVDVWGNIPGAGSETLGMLFPSDTTPFEDTSWGG